MAWHAIQDSVHESESLSDLSDFAERLYWRMLARSDQWGRAPGSLRKIRARCIPLLRTIPDEMLISAINELGACRRVQLYQDDDNGDWYYQIVDFDDHQPRELLRKRGTASRYPEPPGQMTLLPYATAASLRAAVPSPGADADSVSAQRRLLPPLGAPDTDTDEIQMKTTDQRRNVAREGAREAGRVGLSDERIVDDPLADVESRVARRESAFGSHGIVGRLLEVIPDAAPNTASVLHSLFGPLGEDAVEKARSEILDRRDEIRSPAKYAVGIGKRLAAKQGAAA